MRNSAVLLISCPERKGEVAAITDFVFRHNGDILHADEHADQESNLFLMRVEFDPSEFDIDLADFSQHFAPIAKKFEMQWRLARSNACSFFGRCRNHVREPLRPAVGNRTQSRAGVGPDSSWRFFFRVAFLGIPPHFLTPTGPR